MSGAVGKVSDIGDRAVQLGSAALYREAVSSRFDSARSGDPYRRAARCCFSNGHEFFENAERGTVVSGRNVGPGADDGAGRKWRGGLVPGTGCGGGGAASFQLPSGRNAAAFTEENEVGAPVGGGFESDGGCLG